MPRGFDRFHERRDTLLLGGHFAPDSVLELSGRAVLVAGFLSLTVDRYLEEQLASEGLSALLQAALGVSQPQSVQALIKEIGNSK